MQGRGAPVATLPAAAGASDVDPQMEFCLVRLGNISSVSAVAALGLTAAAGIVTMGSVAPAPAPTPAAHADSTVLLAVVDGTVLISTPAPTRSLARNVRADRAVSPGHAELELAGLSAMAAERDLAQDQAGEASALLETMKTARAGAVELATRAAERARLASASPRELGQLLAAERGFTGSQWSCLDSLWQRESNWNPNAQNPSSGAYGIPQSLPGSKMATVASDWRTNPATQITWGLNYIVDRYGSPCGAWGHSESVGWY